MLPSTGDFKGFNCPFYESGLCERPYCHFRHAKKESQNLASDAVDSGAILQQLISEAVKKVIQQTEASNSPTHTQVDSETNLNKEIQPLPKVTYNPTPISELKKINTTNTENEENELKKRHIPVPYTPRKPPNISIKRPVETNGDKPFVFIPPPLKYLPGSADGPVLDPYTPKGSSESTEKYLPGVEVEVQEYKPVETKSANKINYIPSDKTVSKKKILEYKPTKVKSHVDLPTVTYQPTPLSQVPCFSSDEDEPVVKKRKVSTDLNTLDELGAEFDILGQILDEEKSTEENKKQVDTKNNIEGNSIKDEKNTDSKKKYSKTAERDVRDKSYKDNKGKLDKDIKVKSDKDGKVKSDKDSKVKSDKDSAVKSDKDNKLKSNRDIKIRSSKDPKDKSEDENNEKFEKNSKEKHKSSRSSISKDKHRSKSKDSDGKSHHKSSSKDKNRDKEKISDNDKKRHSSEKISNSDSKRRHTSKHSSHSKSREKDKLRHEHKNSKEKRSKDKKKHREKLDHTSDDNDDNAVEILSVNDELIEVLSESDEDTIAMECKKIFEEYVPTPKLSVVEDLPLKDNPVEEEYIPTKKRISRTTEKNIKVVPREPVKPDFKVNAAQTMAERLGKIREYHASKNAISNSVTVTEASKSTFTTTTSSTSSKIRIAHVPYASTLLNAKRTIPPKVEVSKTQPSTSTTIQTIKKGSLRTAHVPNEKFIDRPGVLEPLASKIPANIRSTYLNMMIDECLKIYLSTTDAYARAQHEELSTSKKCKTIPIYKNSAVLAVNRLRKELQECNGIKKSGLDCNNLQKIPTSLSGTGSNSGSWSIENKNKSINFSNECKGGKLFANIFKWILTEEQLQENGFPRPHPSGNKGRAIIYAQNKQKPPNGFYRNCTRCKKEYTVDKKGFPVAKEECIYHPNNKYRSRGEVRYQCCSQDGTSDGCCIATSHVFEYVDYENLKGFVKTMPPEREMDDYGIYSLDCEMCYTTHGLDLTRVTVINSDCKVVYETLIKPLHPIIDYNTRYSGITEEQMAGVKTTLLEVQATLLTMFNSKTILIGHSLESDFKVLKLIHDTVIDTSVLFPHKMGPPYKRALRNLSSDYLKKIIQNSVDGHDSAEDAMVCMELIHYKLKEDLKTR